MFFHHRFSPDALLDPILTLNHLRDVTQGAITHLEEHAVIEGARGHSLADQLDALDNGWEPDKLWAAMVRDAQIWQDQTVAALRCRDAERMTITNRLHDRNYTRIVSVLAQGKFHGSSQNTLVTYFSELDELGSHFVPSLYELYTRPGGARDVLLTDSEGGRQNALAFYCEDVRHRRSATMNPASLTRAVKRVLLRATTRFPFLAITDKQVERFQWTDFRRAHAMTSMGSALDRESVRQLLGESPPEALRTFYRSL